MALGAPRGQRGDRILGPLQPHRPGPVGGGPEGRGCQACVPGLQGRLASGPLAPAGAPLPGQSARRGVPDTAGLPGLGLPRTRRLLSLPCPRLWAMTGCEDSRGPGAGWGQRMNECLQYDQPEHGPGLHPSQTQFATATEMPHVPPTRLVRRVQRRRPTDTPSLRLRPAVSPQVRRV